MQKVIEVNLERGMPAAADAVRMMRDALATAARRGVRAAILIHGYGSTGRGWSIRAAARKALEEPGLRGIVRDFIGGERWHWRKREFLSFCRELSAYEGRVANNEGVTVVILK